MGDRWQGRGLVARIAGGGRSGFGSRGAFSAIDSDGGLSTKGKDGRGEIARSSVVALTSGAGGDTRMMGVDGLFVGTR